MLGRVNLRPKIDDATVYFLRKEWPMNANSSAII